MLRNFLLFSQLFLVLFVFGNFLLEPKVIDVTELDTTNWAAIPKYNKSYFDNGKVKAEGIFLQNFKTGWWVEFYESGKIKSECSSVIDSNILIAINTLMPKNKLESRDSVLNLYDGFWKTYHESGKLESIGEYKNGVQIGYWTRNFENGNTHWIGQFQNGQKTGFWKVLNKEGGIQERGNYILGEKSGFWKMYKNEVVVKSGEYLLGKPIGVWLMYNHQGILMEEYNYDEE